MQYCLRKRFRIW